MLFSCYVNVYIDVNISGIARAVQDVIRAHLQVYCMEMSCCWFGGHLLTSLLFHHFYKHFPQAGAHLRSLDGFLVFDDLKDTEVPKSVTFGVRARLVIANRSRVRICVTKCLCPAWSGLCCRNLPLIA